METQKTILMAVFFFLTYMMWQSWQQTFPDKNQLQPNSTIANASVKSPQPDGDNSVPYLNNTDSMQKNSQEPLAQPSKTTQKLITIKTDLLEYKINLVGGDIVQVKLLKYNNSKGNKGDNGDISPVKLLDNEQDDLYIAPNGLTGNYGPDTQKNRAEYTTSQASYNLQGDKLTVDLYLQNNQDGTNKDIKIIKSFIFEKNKYSVDVKYQITNSSTSDWQGHVFSTLKKKNIKANSGASMLNPSSSSYVGPAVYNTEQKFHKISPESLNNNPQKWDTKGGWIAIIQRYFVSSWIPNKDEQYKYTASINKDDIYSLNLLGPSFTVRPGETLTKTITFYSGPEQADVLGQLATGLDRTVDYGVL
jgi:YidC/Oxa1 family membrane protein insertase